MATKFKTDWMPDQQAVPRATTGTVTKSGVDLADGVLSGYEWSGSSITFAFPDGKGDYGYGGEKDHDFSPVNSKIQDAARRALDQDFGGTANDGFSVEGFTELTVSEGSDSGSDIRYAESSSANPTAYAYYPSGGEIAGDVWFGKSSTYHTPEVGNYAFATVIHETGHALGLKHGHQASSDDLIKTTLEGKYDSLEYSVMTYHSYAGQSDGDAYTNEKFGYPQTYMMADIRALQHMYGADFTTNAGNTVYSWQPDSGRTQVNGATAINPGGNRIFATIWDGGGDDTYDLSAYSSDLAIDLRPGKYSLFKKGQLADLDQFSSDKDRIANGNIYNALQFEGDARSLIENAVGGSGKDTFRGNAADNTYTGNGSGDTFFFRTGSGSDVIADFSGKDKVNLAGMGLDFTDIKGMGADSGSDFVIDFGGGDILTIENKTEASMSDTDFVFS